jgi:geranylgeranyl diphosphate synthase type II
MAEKQPSVSTCTELVYFWENLLRLQTARQYREIFNAYLKESIRGREPKQLYEPMSYILKLGGKRLRPALVLMATEAFKGDIKQALPVSLALEMFHNFSLVHDDIMDGAPLRRGRPTVHAKWGTNTAILSGDAMLILSYQLFESYEPGLFKELLRVFSQTALEVCEGQQYDIEFDDRERITIAEYMHMIRCKTAVLLAACMEAGAIIAGAPEEIREAASGFGMELGIAFQLQDDYLDAFGDPGSFGKQIGGDIIENKKTYLFLKAQELSRGTGAKELEHLFSIRPSDPSSKIQAVLDIYRDTGADAATRNAIVEHTQYAFEFLQKMDLDPRAYKLLKGFGKSLQQRHT